MNKLKVLDLFSGIGGFSLGLERTGGFETVAFCEIDEAARKVLDKHWPDVVKFEDVNKLKYRDLVKIEQVNNKFVKKVLPDVICGGFPCQDISVAGNKKGLRDELGKRTRSGLWEEFARLIKEIKPRYVIIENVANLRSKGLNEVLKDLWKIGYDAEWHIISARSVGACHLRERIWIIAYPNSERSQGLRSSKRVQEKHSSFDSSHAITSYPNSTGVRDESSKLSDSRRKASRTRTEGILQEDRQAQDMERGTSSIIPAYPNNFRLWKSFASQEEKQEWWSEAALSVSHWQETQSIVRGVDDGISRGVDKYRRERIKQLGNAVVPQIPQLIGQAILDYENELKAQNDYNI